MAVERGPARLQLRGVSHQRRVRVAAQGRPQRHGDRRRPRAADDREREHPLPRQCKLRDGRLRRGRQGAALPLRGQLLPQRPRQDSELLNGVEAACAQAWAAGAEKSVPLVRPATTINGPTSRAPTTCASTTASCCPTAAPTSSGSGSDRRAARLSDERDEGRASGGLAARTRPPYRPAMRSLFRGACALALVALASGCPSKAPETEDAIRKRETDALEARVT